MFKFVNFEHVSHLDVVCLLLTFIKKTPAGYTASLNLPKILTKGITV